MSLQRLLWWLLPILISSNFFAILQLVKLRKRLTQKDTIKEVKDNTESQIGDDLEQERKLRKDAEKNREHERKGRIEAEKALRQLQLQSKQTEKSETDEDEDQALYDIKPIGHIRSCFRQRYGTPRQGLLVPNSRGKVTLATTTNPIESLANITEFTHVWLIFIFHENTNSAKELKRNVLNKQKNNKNISAVKSKVKPPRLDGAKVGLFSTRTPHRPNPIGLSVAKVDRVDEKGVLYLSGIDLVDGTPILDIKPYVKEYDSLPDAITPEWIYQNPKVESLHEVIWPENIIELLQNHSESLELYESVDDVRDAIDQIIRLDIRSVNQRNHKKEIVQTLRIDNLSVTFTSSENSATIKNVELATEEKNNKN